MTAENVKKKKVTISHYIFGSRKYDSKYSSETARRFRKGSIPYVIIKNMCKFEGLSNAIKFKLFH